MSRIDRLCRSCQRASNKGEAVVLDENNQCLHYVTEDPYPNTEQVDGRRTIEIGYISHHHDILDEILKRGFNRFFNRLIEGEAYGTVDEETTSEQRALPEAGATEHE